MADRSTIAQKTNILRASTWGSNYVSGFRTLQGAELIPSFKPETKSYRAQNAQFAGATTYEREWSEATLGGALSYNEAQYWMAGICEWNAPTTPSGATLTRRWVTSITNATPVDSTLYQMERGTSDHASYIRSAFFTEYGQTWTRKGVSHSGKLIGQPALDYHAFALYLVGATGGTFTVTVNGQTTAGQAYNVSASSLQTAINGLSSVGSGGCTVSLSSSTYRIIFDGTTTRYLSIDLTASGASLTGTTPTLTVSQLICDAPTNASSRDTLTLIPMSGRADIRIAATQADLATATPLERAFKFAWKIGDRYAPIFPMVSSSDGPAGRVQGMLSSEVSLRLGADLTGMSYLNTLRNAAKIFIRLTHTGPAIESGFTYANTLDVCCTLQEIDAPADEENLVVAEYKGEIAFDATWGQGIYSTIDNIVTG